MKKCALASSGPANSFSFSFTCIHLVSVIIFFEDGNEDEDEDIDLLGVSYLPSHSKDPFVQVPRLLLDLLLVPAILGFLTS